MGVEPSALKRDHISKYRTWNLSFLPVQKISKIIKRTEERNSNITQCSAKTFQNGLLHNAPDSAVHHVQVPRPVKCSPHDLTDSTTGLDSHRCFC